MSTQLISYRSRGRISDVYARVHVTSDATVYDEAYEGGCLQEPLALENTLWANTVLA